jgi:hypothetical protein
VKQALLTLSVLFGNLLIPIMPGSLDDTLRRMQFQSLIREAKTIREYRPGRERDDAAWKYLRQTRLDRMVGKITQEQEFRIFSIFSFAMPADAPAVGESPALDPNEEPTVDAEEETAIPHDVACHIGCEACDSGGRMTDDEY